MAFDLTDEELKATREFFASKRKKKEGLENMVLPNKKSNLVDVSLGTAYDINKNLVEKYEKEIPQDRFENLKSIFMEYMQNNRDQYYMLLCNEEKDYTIFNLCYDDELINSEESAFKNLKECVYNRGQLYGFDITEDTMAIEIWIKKDDGMHCYYFFKYGEAVIEC